ncbi:MAG: hypothetical protein M3384_10660 [Acidobacteriota bacterium]|nr:hypothetical protein [Acidobacteriota bacterium]
MHENGVIIAFLIWCLLVLVIPLLSIAAGFLKYRKTRDAREMISRLILAFLIYVPATVLSGVPLGGAMNAMAHRRSPSPGEMLFCFAVVFIYGGIGCFLWLLMKRDFIKPLLIFSRDYNKPQTLFDESGK